VVLRQEVAALRAELTALKADLAVARKNSSNSSKPPSSDIVKPPRPSSAVAGQRKRGGQPGHARHERPPFASEEIDERLDYTLSVCPDCGGRVTLLDLPARVVQQVEIVAKPTTVSEHRSRACYCRRCQKTHYAELPAPVRRAGLVGPRLMALVDFSKGAVTARLRPFASSCATSSVRL